MVEEIQRLSYVPIHLARNAKSDLAPSVMELFYRVASEVILHALPPSCFIDAASGARLHVVNQD